MRKHKFIFQGSVEYKKKERTIECFAFLEIQAAGILLCDTKIRNLVHIYKYLCLKASSYVIYEQ